MSPNRLIVEDDVEKGDVDLHFAVVFDEAQVSEFVHKEVDPRARRPDHLREGFLGDLGYPPLWPRLIAARPRLTSTNTVAWM